MSDDSLTTPGVSGWCSPQITGLTGAQGVDCPQCERVGGAGHQVHHQEWAGLAVLGEDLLPGGRHRHHDLQAGVVPCLHRVGVRAEDLNKEQLNWPEWTAVNQTSHCSQWVHVKQFIFATDTMGVSHWLTAGPGWSRQNIFKDWSEVKWSEERTWNCEWVMSSTLQDSGGRGGNWDRIWKTQGRSWENIPAW